MDIGSRYKKIIIPKDKGIKIFIVGDIHGRYDILKKTLKYAGYDENKDYLFATGDLIDRGTESVEVLKYITEHSRRFTVLGNHENMIIDPFSYEMWVTNGGFYTLDSLNKKGLSIDWLREKVDKFPYIIDVESFFGNFRITHSEIPSGTTEYIFQESLLDEHSIIWNTLLWGRQEAQVFQEYESINLDFDKLHTDKIEKQILKFYKNLKKGNMIENFCGHNILNNPLFIPNRTYLDLGMEDMCIFDYGDRIAYRYSDIK